MSRRRLTLLLYSGRIGVDLPLLLLHIILRYATITRDPYVLFVGTTVHQYAGDVLFCESLIVFSLELMVVPYLPIEVRYTRRGSIPLISSIEEHSIDTIAS